VIFSITNYLSGKCVSTHILNKHWIVTVTCMPPYPSYTLDAHINMPLRVTFSSQLRRPSIGHDMAWHGMRFFQHHHLCLRVLLFAVLADLFYFSSNMSSVGAFKPWLYCLHSSKLLQNNVWIPFSILLPVGLIFLGYRNFFRTLKII
jgi:hypothetical protein